MKRLPIAILSIILCTGCGQSGTGAPSTTPTTTGNTTITPNPNKPLILAAIATASEIGTNQGLRAFAKNNALGAAEAATALKQAIETDLLPYLNGGKIGTSAEVQALLNSSLFSAKISPQIRDAIAASAAVLDAYLTAPSATTFLSAENIDCIKAFLSGIDNGCADFQSKALFKQQRWIEISK